MRLCSYALPSTHITLLWRCSSFSARAIFKQLRVFQVFASGTEAREPQPVARILLTWDGNSLGTTTVLQEVDGLFVTRGSGFERIHS